MPLVCPLCGSQDVRSSDIVSDVTVAKCDRCQILFTIQRDAKLPPTSSLNEEFRGGKAGDIRKA